MLDANPNPYESPRSDFARSSEGGGKSEAAVDLPDVPDFWRAFFGPFLTAWAGTIAAGAVFGAILEGQLGFIFGALLAGFFGTPVFVAVGLITRLLLFDRFVLAIAVASGAFTGGFAAFVLWGGRSFVSRAIEAAIGAAFAGGIGATIVVVLYAAAVGEPMRHYRRTSLAQVTHRERLLRIALAAVVCAACVLLLL